MEKPVCREEGQPLFCYFAKTLLCKAVWLELEEVVEVVGFRGKEKEIFGIRSNC